MVTRWRVTPSSAAIRPRDSPGVQAVLDHGHTDAAAGLAVAVERVRGTLAQLGGRRTPRLDDIGERHAAAQLLEHPPGRLLPAEQLLAQRLGGDERPLDRLDGLGVVPSGDFRPRTSVMAITLP